MVKKHWLKLGAVAVALLLIPRRSSRQAQDTPYNGDGGVDNTGSTDRPVKPVATPSTAAPHDNPKG